MEKKRVRLYKETRFPAEILFLCGFLLGTILPNLAWRFQWKQQALAAFYLLGAFAARSVSGREYLLEVLRLRGGFLFLSILCGFSVFGLPLAAGSVLLQGMETGGMLAVSILQFGLAGGAVGTGLLLPQYLVYLPVNFYIMGLIFRQSLGIWRNQGLFPQKISRYVLRTTAAALLYLAGILLEVYVNPWLMEKILSGLNFF